MWNREQLKNTAKNALDINYWKIVLVSLIAGVVGAGSASNYSFEINTDSLSQDIPFSGFGGYGGFFPGEIAGILVRILFVLPFIILLALAIAFAFSAFIGNPIGVGAKRFFFLSLKEKAEGRELTYAIDHNYMNVVKILFMRDIKVFLWSLLFVIPGIIKAYEYYMVPYLLAENPDLTRDEAFRLSKQMMTGNKWDTFVLELSFIGWDILSAISLGIAGIFFVQPYKNLTFAALYEEISAINGHPARATATTGCENYTYRDEI